MSKQTESKLFIVSSLITHAGFYQELLKGLSSYQQLGNRILKEIKTARAFRQNEKVEELSKILMNIPIKEYQLIGEYYFAWRYCREDISQAKTLEKIAEQSQTYKAQALLMRAAIEGYQCNIESEFYFYTEALKTHPALSEYLKASIAIAVIKSKEGFHKSALKELESLIPLIRHAEPLIYSDFLNSYAVELSEVGRKQEARNVIKQVLESPFIIAYPEWRETAGELKPANRSFAVLNPTRQRRGKLLSMPVIEHAEPVKQDRPALVINLETWKAKMGKKKNGKNRTGLDGRQLLLRLVELSTAPGMTDDKLYKVVALMEKLLTEPDEPQKPDGDNPSA
jgi:hypothetical protein